MPSTSPSDSAPALSTEVKNAGKTEKTISEEKSFKRLVSPRKNMFLGRPKIRLFISGEALLSGPGRSLVHDGSRRHDEDAASVHLSRSGHEKDAFHSSAGSRCGSDLGQCERASAGTSKHGSTSSSGRGPGPPG